MESERRKIGKVLVFAVLFVTLAFVSAGCASAATHYVNPGESIQAAIDNATIGDTIIVRDGPYVENVNANKRLTIQSEMGSDFTIVHAANPDDHVFEVTEDYVNISGFTIRGATETNLAGISLTYADHCTISENTVWSNSYGIFLWYSSNNTLTGNIVNWNTGNGIMLYSSSINTLTGNTASYNDYSGIAVYESNNNMLTNNTASYNINIGIKLGNSSTNNLMGNTANSNNYYGIVLSWESNNNTLTGNTANLNNWYGIYLYRESNNNTLTGNTANLNNRYGILLKSASNNNIIYFNNFMNNTGNVRSHNSTNIWNSTEKITYTYKGKTYTNYLGNYWDDYEEKYPDAEEIDGSGIWNTHYSIDSDNDNYPLMDPWENYFKLLVEGIFDTGSPANPYPSIMGTHNGTIKPSYDVVVNKMYTYPCVGTGGHSEYVEISNESGIVATGYWKGYKGDYHNITFPQQFTLLANHRYNYTIITGSYPQIIHEHVFNTISDGEITCIEFIDANGKSYDNWIPAIRLE